VFDKRTGIYALALQPDNRFPFKPDDELSKPGDKPAEGATEQAAEKAAEKAVAKAAPKAAAKGLPAIVYAGLAERLYEVPLAPVTTARVDDKRLYFLDADGSDGKANLKTLAIAGNGPSRNSGGRRARVRPVATASTSTTAPSPPARATCWWWRRAPKRRPTSQGQGQGG
jgi:hypothetical protein